MGSTPTLSFYKHRNQLETDVSVRLLFEMHVRKKDEMRKI